MKTRILLVSLLLGVVGTTSAATLGNAQGQTCATTGLWHFVNNQTGGVTTPGTLVAQWTGGSCEVTASSVNQNVQHFYCTGSGTLLNAVTNLPGRLVLSHYTCGVEPPKCDPKTDPKCTY